MNYPKRGIRNNNPFNIKKSHHDWLGKKQDGADPTFEQFDTLELGVRAGLKLLTTYINRGYDTPEKIIKRFAPTSENNTENYIDFICYAGQGRIYINRTKRITNRLVLCTIASRMLRYENSLNMVELDNLKLTTKDLLDVYKKYNLKID